MRENDRVVIKFGPARYDSDKAIRSKIDDAIDEATNDAYNSIVNNPNLNLAGGGGGGTPTVNPFGIPQAFLSPNFPIETYPNIPFDLMPNTRTGRYGNPQNNLTTIVGDSFIYDISGAGGYGADAIIAGKGGTQTTSGTNWTEINAFIRSNGTNVSLYAPQPSLATDLYMNPSGRVISIRSTATGFDDLAHRAPADISWTTVSTTAELGFAYDYQNGNFWYVVDPSGVPDLVRLSPSDTAFVSKGALGLPTGSYTDNGVIAGYGKLAILRGGNYYQKNSNDDNNPTLLCSFTLASFVVDKGTRMAPSGKLSYLRDDSTTGNVHLRTLNINGTVSDADLSLDSTLFNFSGMSYLANGKLAMCFAVDDSVFGGSAGERWPAIGIYDGATTTIVYYDSNGYSDATSPVVFMSNPVEVSPNVIRFAATPMTATSTLRATYVYELTIT